MKNFEQNGNEYKLKFQSGTYGPLIGIVAVLAIVGFIKIPESSFKWWMVGVAVILVLALLRTYLIIDIGRREIRSRKGLFGKEVILPLEKLEGFTIQRLKQYGLITINVSLLARYRDAKGKRKELQLAQAFFTRPIQSILNDVDEILGDEHLR